MFRESAMPITKIQKVSVPLRGVGCFWDNGAKAYGS